MAEVQADKIRVGALRGIMMRAPGITSTVGFYENNWGLSVSHKEDGTILLRGTSAEPFLYGLRDDKTYGVDYVHFSMPDRQSMDALHSQIIQKGYQPLSAPDTFDDFAGGYGFEVLDPDNRRLRFRCDAKLLEVATGNALPAKVSHVVLNTPDMEGTQEWYTEVLGFRVSDYSADQMVFLRCNTDHHSIALVRAQYPSVNHVAFEMPTINDFMRGIGRMKQQGHVPTWGPGRHGPGDNPFAYFVSPSGFVIEFTSELQQIDDEVHVAQVWPRDDPEKMDRWMTAGPPTTAQRAIMQGRPDPGFPELRQSDE